MTENQGKQEGSTTGTSSLRREDVLLFKPPGRPIALENVRDEMLLMREHLKDKVLTPNIARRVCEKSGSHLVKMVSPRTDGEHACLYIESKHSNLRPKILPSTNAPDIPFCKVLYRPLEILGHPTRSIIEDIMNPDDASPKVLEAFAAVFGHDVLKSMREALLERPKRVTKLGAGEFPIIFVPRPGGGDLQITPVSPATAFTGMKRVVSPFFAKQKKDGPKVARGKFHKQSISSKPQNISGAIGGPRTRLEAIMPSVMDRADAEIHRYLRGGSFPRLTAVDIDVWILRYADMLDTDSNYNDRNTRAALDRTADRLIREAREFIEEMIAEAQLAAKALDIDPDTFGIQPRVASVLIRRFWSNDSFARARKALTSTHFEHRLTRSGADEETLSK